MPQLVFARPSWSSTDNDFCSVQLNTSLPVRDLTVVSGTVYIKAVMDHKYDGLQLRDLTISLVRRRAVGDEELDTVRDAVLRLPVLYTLLHCSTA